MTPLSIQEKIDTMNKEEGYLKYSSLTSIEKTGGKVSTHEDEYVPNPYDWAYVKKLGVWYPVKCLLD